MTDQSIITETLVWRGVTIEVSYEADWAGTVSRGSGLASSHLELRALAPPQAPLPVTETGFRSHFLTPGLVEEAGGPAVYVRAWLDESAKSKAWLRAEEKRRQLDLFA